MFDAITYGKGSAVLHMVDEFTGTESFRAGVQRLPARPRVRQHRDRRPVREPRPGLGMADQRDHEHLDLPKGFPQIEVTDVAGGVRLAQRPLPGHPRRRPTPRRGRCRSRSGDPRPVSDFAQKVLLTADEMVVDVGDVDWIVANVGGHGFYRTHYSDELFADLLAHLERARRPRALLARVRHPGAGAQRRGRRGQLPRPGRRVRGGTGAGDLVGDHRRSGDARAPRAGVRGPSRVRGLRPIGRRAAARPTGTEPVRHRHRSRPEAPRRPDRHARHPRQRPGDHRALRTDRRRGAGRRRPSIPIPR